VRLAEAYTMRRIWECPGLIPSPLRGESGGKTWPILTKYAYRPPKFIRKSVASNPHCGVTKLGPLKRERHESRCRRNSGHGPDAFAGHHERRRRAPSCRLRHLLRKSTNACKYLLYQRQQRQAKILQCQKKKRGVAQSVHYIFVKRYGKRGWIRHSNIIVGNINDVKRCMSFYRKVSIPNPDFRPLQ